MLPRIYFSLSFFSLIMLPHFYELHESPTPVVFGIFLFLLLCLPSARADLAEGKGEAVFEPGTFVSCAGIPHPDALCHNCAVFCNSMELDDHETPVSQSTYSSCTMSLQLSDFISRLFKHDISSGNAAKRTSDCRKQSCHTSVMYNHILHLLDSFQCPLVRSDS